MKPEVTGDEAEAVLWVRLERWVYVLGPGCPSKGCEQNNSRPVPETGQWL